jgi:myo-inositol-1(or 4)-monophosphatase
MRMIDGSEALTELAVALAQHAGALARDGRRARFGVDTKSTPTDVVTEVDRAVESWLVAEIGRLRPDDAVLGEEGGGRAGTSGVRWVIDPIDGTVNFVLGIPQYAVSIAAERDGVAVAGAVHNPESGETFWATRGAGAWLDERRLTGPARDVPLSQAVIGTGFAYDSARRRRQVAVLAELIDQIADIRRAGAASLDLCAVAAGRLDAYYEVGLNPWDWAAGLLIAQEAGCAATGLRGRPPGSQFVAVATPKLIGPFAQTLERLDADVD